MSMHFTILFTLLTLLAPIARADDSASSGSSDKAKYPYGIQATMSGGQGFSAIQNPDGTTAYYQTIAVEGKGHLPIYGTPQSRIALELIGSLRYLDLKNTASVANEKEVANLIGPGAGIHLRLLRLIGGAQYDYIFARHYAVGPISRELDYSMTLMHTYYGLQYSFGQLSVAATYSTSTGTVPKASSGLSSDSAYTDQIYWLNFTYSTGQSFWHFVEMLF